MHLTKSLFVDFMDYPKLARRKANNPTVYKKIRKIETEEQEDHIMAIGQAVEDVVKTYLEQRYNTTALDLMPRRHKLKDEESDDDDEVFIKAELNLPTALADTIKAIRDHVPVLYQPTFQYGECLVRADFMVRNGSSYDLYEAKAKSGIRKDITDDGEKKPLWSIESKFIHDVSFQSYVINHSLAAHDLGQLRSVFIVYLNKEYIKNGSLNINSLIRPDQAGRISSLDVIQRNKPTTLEINDSLLSAPELELKINQMKNYITLTEQEANRQFLRAGTRYLEYFGEDKPFGTVMGMGIHHSNASYVQDLFYQWRTNIADLTAEEIEWFNANGQNFITNYLHCKSTHAPIGHRQKIQEIFDRFSYPICFYDYETISIPVPIMDQTRPYMQTIVQYSFHKYEEDGTMKHYGGVFAWEWEYSCTEITLPSHPNMVDEEHERVITGHYTDLLKQMIADIGDDLTKSTFIVWHEWFENSRNKEVAKLFPALADSFLAINEHTYDLKKIVSDWYYFNPDCKGSASIKKVLPVLVPDMTYEGMEIGRGDIAMKKLHDLITGDIPAPERESVIQNLLLYCWQDTLAMVKIFEALREL